MHLVFQVPVIDLRQPSQVSETINVWPTADMSRAQVEELIKKAPFIRNFGKVTSGTEGYYCNINCVKPGSMHDKGFPLNESVTPIFNINKILRAGGIYTVHAEIGFSDQLESMLKFNAPKEPVHISDILQHYISMPLLVQDIVNSKDEISNTTDVEKSANHWAAIKLGDLGSVLAKNYCYATTKNKEQPAANEYVINGEACIALTFAADDNIHLPVNAEKLDEFNIEGSIVQLYGYKCNFKQHVFKVWLFQLNELGLLKSHTVLSELQNRHVNLFRLNSEKETVRILMNGFDSDNSDPALKNYLKKTPAKIFKKERFSNPQGSVRNFALQSEEDNVQFATLLEEKLKKVLDEHVRANLKNLENKMKASPPKKSILFITSNPTDSNPIDFGEQFKKISEALQSGTDRDYFTLLPLASGVERDKVMKILSDNTPDYIHITLHASEIKGLYFQDSAKKPDPMSAEEFADYIKLLTDLKKPDAIILCACNSLGHATAVKQYCNFSMGTNYVFPDPAAIVYAKKFYDALFNGKEVQFCHKVAVQGIKYNRPPFDAIDDNEVYNIPQLI
ncbi:MAG: hypothetical protein ABI723_22705 [Bacteroidia bacterium]